MTPARDIVGLAVAVLGTEVIGALSGVTAWRVSFVAYRDAGVRRLN